LKLYFATLQLCKPTLYYVNVISFDNLM